MYYTLRSRPETMYYTLRSRPERCGALQSRHARRHRQREGCRRRERRGEVEVEAVGRDLGELEHEVGLARSPSGIRRHAELEVLDGRDLAPTHEVERVLAVLLDRVPLHAHHQPRVVLRAAIEEGAARQVLGAAQRLQERRVGRGRFHDDGYLPRPAAPTCWLPRGSARTATSRPRRTGASACPRASPSAASRPADTTGRTARCPAWPSSA